MHKTEHLSEGVTLYLGDCREILPTLGKVDTVVTSPPYDMQREYGLKDFDWRETVGHALIQFPNNAQVLVNLGLVHRDGHLKRYWDALIVHMEAHGWRLFAWYVWDQMSGLPGDWHGRLAPSHEFVFHFNKSFRVVNKTKRTKGGTQHGPGLKEADGSANGKSHAGKPCQPFKIPDSIIRTARETQSGPGAEHPARFPLAFATELVAPFSDEGEIICDPFMGSGTTGVACIKLGRKFIGIEIEPRYFDIACRRISAELARPRLPLDRPPKQEAML